MDGTDDSCRQPSSQSRPAALGRPDHNEAGKPTFARSTGTGNQAGIEDLAHNAAKLNSGGKRPKSFPKLHRKRPPHKIPITKLNLEPCKLSLRNLTYMDFSFVVFVVIASLVRRTVRVGFLPSLLAPLPACLPSLSIWAAQQAQASLYILTPSLSK